MKSRNSACDNLLACYEAGTTFTVSFLSSATSGAFLTVAASSAVAYRPVFFGLGFSLILVFGVMATMRLLNNVNTFQRNQKAFIGLVRGKWLNSFLSKSPNIETARSLL
jgi:hypothetical protein